MRLSKARVQLQSVKALGWHQSSQTHCQLFLLERRGGAREPEGLSHTGSSPTQQLKGSRDHSNKFHLSNSTQPILQLCQDNSVPLKQHCCSPALCPSSGSVVVPHTFLHPPKKPSSANQGRIWSLCSHSGPMRHRLGVSQVSERLLQHLLSRQARVQESSDRFTGCPRSRATRVGTCPLLP